MVDERLAAMKKSKTWLSKKLGYATYQGYHDLFVGGRIKLTDEKLAEIADILGWPRDHFNDPRATLRRDEYINREFSKFLETAVGRDSHPETIRILRSMQWTGEFLPSARLYRDVALMMEGRYTPAQILDAQRLEEEDAATGRTPDETHRRRVAARKH